MIRISRLKPFLSASAVKTFTTPISHHRLQTPLQPKPHLFPPVQPHSLIQFAAVSGTPKGKARLKSIHALKKKSFTQKKKGQAEDPRAAAARGRGPLAVKSRRVVLRLNSKLREREVERESLGLMSKLRLRDAEIEKARALEAEKKGADEMMGREGMTLAGLGFVEATAVPEYKLTVEDGRKLAKEYSKLMMKWHRDRQAWETGLMVLRREAIEALPEKLRMAALMPVPKKKMKKEEEVEGGDKKKKVATKGKTELMAGKRPGMVPGKKGAGKPQKKG